MNNCVCRLIVSTASFLVPPTTMASELNVCSLKNNSEQSIGKTVSFRGSILSDGVHSTLIYSDDCQNTGFIIARDNVGNSPSAIIRQAIMRVGSPGTVDKNVTVEVDAMVTVIDERRIALKITKLKHMKLMYPSGNRAP